MANSPGNEGKWFAAAKSAGMYREAIEMANRTPCDPKTLIRAARDMKSREPYFSVEAGLTALRWLAAGYGYEITGMDVREAFQFAMEAARNTGGEREVIERVRAMMANLPSPNQMVGAVLFFELEKSIR